MRLNLHFRTPE